jgi:Ran GTPase-activating protein (RanGAP) involved in mRNA processing and transport
MFPKESAIMILGKGKKKRPDEDEMDAMDYEDEDEEEEMEGYSDEQYEMADELISAVQGGDSEAVLDAIHGIYNSY